MAKVLDCSVEVCEFELQLRYYIHFWNNALGKDISLLIPPAMGSIVPLLFFYRDGFGIK